MYMQADYKQSLTIFNIARCAFQTLQKSPVS